MRYLNRYVLICCTLVLTLCAGVSYAAHMYYIGTLTALADDQLIMDSKKYLLAPKVKVLLRVVGSNGAVHQQVGRLSDLSAGNKVTIKVSNGQVTEVEKVVSR